MKIKSLLIISILCAAASLLQAQTNYQPGFVLTTPTDTLHGSIDYRGDLTMGSLCRWQSADGVIKEFGPDEIYGYRLADGKFFISKMVDGKSVFLEYLINGKVSIYSWRNMKGSHFFMEKEDMQLIEIPYEEGTRIKDDEEYFYRSTQHQGLLRLYTQDAPELANRISTIKTPQPKNLVKFAKAYHNATCDDGGCIIYEKKQPWIKINPEISAGITGFSTVYLEYYLNEPVEETNFFRANVLGHIWLPNLNRNFYLKTGISRISIVSEWSTQTRYLVPIQIEYIYPRGLIRPKLAYGMNLYRQLEQTVSITGGVNVHLHDKVSLSLNADMDFVPTKVSIVPRSVFSYGLAGGVYLTF